MGLPAGAWAGGQRRGALRPLGRPKPGDTGALNGVRAGGVPSGGKSRRLWRRRCGSAAPAVWSCAGKGSGEDSQTRLGCLPLRLTFGSGGVAGLEVKLGGKTYPAAGAAVTSTFSGTPLTAVGEEEPFAWQDAQWSYQVELTGIHVPGLERMAAFTAEIGDDVYTGCRWKKLDPAGGRPYSRRRAARERRSLREPRANCNGRDRGEEGVPGGGAG